MMKFEQICQSLNTYLGQNPVIRVLMPLGMPLMFVCVILQILGRFISLGSVISTVAFLGFFFFLLLVLSNCNFKMAAVGLGLFTITYLYSFLYSLFKYRNFNYSAVIYVLVFGFFAWQAWRKSLQINH